MKTAQLIGPPLDYWVARALGRQARINFNEAQILRPQTEHRGVGDQWHVFEPSTRPDHGHPIIESEGIELQCRARGSRRRMGEWFAYGQSLPMWIGPTALVAAMRAVVAGKFGDTVPDEIG